MKNLEKPREQTCCNYIVSEKERNESKGEEDICFKSLLSLFCVLHVDLGASESNSQGHMKQQFLFSYSEKSSVY